MPRWMFWWYWIDVPTSEALTMGNGGEPLPPASGDEGI